MPNHTWWIALLCACHETSTGVSPIEGGDLIAIDEGQKKTFHVAEIRPLSGQPEWVSVDLDHQGLVVDLSKHCDLVATTVGAPRVFALRYGAHRAAGA